MDRCDVVRDDDDDDGGDPRALCQPGCALTSPEKAFLLASLAELGPSLSRDDEAEGTCPLGSREGGFLEEAVIRGLADLEFNPPTLGMAEAGNDRIPADPNRLPVNPLPEAPPPLPLPFFLFLALCAETSFKTWAELSSATP